MFHALTGTLSAKRPHFFAVEVGGISFKLMASVHVLSALPGVGERVSVYTYLHVREDALELYGFLSEGELNFFEKLNTISGVGPKSALGIMGVAPVDQLIAAINAGRTELLTRASGIGRKTAERVILELKGKLAPAETKGALSRMESDADLEETLMSLGFSRVQAKEAIQRVDPHHTVFTDRLKEALKQPKRK